MDKNLNSKTASDAGRWALRDWIDFEFFFGEDEEEIAAGNVEDLRTRDEKIRADLEARGGAESSTSPNRSRLLRFWLEQRRARQFGAELAPGEQVESLLGWVSVALAVAGLLLAKGAVWSFFRASESLLQRPEPVNVFWFAVVCIGLPLLFTLYGFWLFLGAQAAPGFPRAPAFLRGALFGLLRPLTARAVRKVSSASTAEKRLRARAFWGAFRRRALDHKTVLGRQLTCVIQWFGLGFAAGILLFSWVDCLFYSRVFGWQSTAVSLTPEAAYRTVRAIAVPWSWLAPDGSGFPTLEQVAATRFIRYRDPAPFPPDAASAWANFLMAAVLVYGLLPRVALYVLSRWQLRRALAFPDFGQVRFDRLWERLTQPRISMGGERSETGPVPLDSPPVQARQTTAGLNCLVLLPEELADESRETAVREWLRAKKGWSIQAVVPLPNESNQSGQSGGADSWGRVQRASAEMGAARAVLVQESFMPPGKAALNLVRQVKTAFGGGVVLALLGKPGSDPLGEPPNPTDLAVWRAKIVSLGDSNIDLFSFREPSA